MKIVFIINNLGGGGAERVVCTLARHFSAQGHEMEIINLHGGPICYDLSPGTRLHILKSRWLSRGPGKILTLPLCAWELSRLLKRLQPDATMSFLTRSNLAHILTRSFGNKNKIYISERIASDIEYSLPLKRILGTLVRRFYPAADQIVAISHGVKESLGKLGVPLSIITTIHNPQEIQAIKTKAREVSGKKYDSHFFTIVMAGRLVAQKDYPTMLEALKILVHERKLKVKLIVLGQGPDKAKLEREARELEIADHVEWKGWISNAFSLMATCDAFAFTSIYEGFGNVLVEAMACGLPVISTDCKAGPSEILEKGKYGFLVPVGDSRAIADAIESLMSDPQIYSDYKNRAIQGAERFDVSMIAEQYMDLLEGKASVFGESAPFRHPSLRSG